MVKVQKIAPYNFEFRKISVLSSQIECQNTVDESRVSMYFIDSFVRR